MPSQMLLVSILMSWEGGNVVLMFTIYVCVFIVMYIGVYCCHTYVVNRIPDRRDCSLLGCRSGTDY